MKKAGLQGKEGQAGTLAFIEGAGSLQVKRGPKCVLVLNSAPSGPATGVQTHWTGTSAVPGCKEQHF